MKNLWFLKTLARPCSCTCLFVSDNEDKISRNQTYFTLNKVNTVSNLANGLQGMLYSLNLCVKTTIGEIVIRDQS